MPKLEFPHKAVRAMILRSGVHIGSVFLLKNSRMLTVCMPSASALIMIRACANCVLLRSRMHFCLPGVFCIAFTASPACLQGDIHGNGTMHHCITMYVVFSLWTGMAREGGVWGEWGGSGGRRGLRGGGGLFFAVSMMMMMI